MKTALADTDIEVQAGDQAVANCVTAPEIDTVVTAMVGIVDWLQLSKPLAQARK